MKKLGMAVCYDTKNFGSQLQVLATVNKVTELGFSPKIIQYQKKLSPKFIMQSIPRLFNPSFVRGKLNSLKKDQQIQKHPDIAKKIVLRNHRFDEFVDKNFRDLLISYNGWEQLVKGTSDNFDVYLCGSDQLWLPSNLGSHFYTLEFAPEEKPKISYATSFGVSDIPCYQRKRTAKYLNRFSALSTRELSGIKIIKELTGVTAPVVCDPTMLFDANEWLNIIPYKEIIEEPYILCYFLGTNIKHREEANKLSSITGLKIVTCPFLDNFVEYDEKFGDIRMYDMDAADFVNLIRNADYVLTDSFHGSVFSILYHKKFLTFDRFVDGPNSRNSRITSLFSMLGLEKRKYRGNIAIINDEINYASVETKLFDLRKNSNSYLAGALSAR